jgi:hypothetical protein
VGGGDERNENGQDFHESDQSPGNESRQLPTPAGQVHQKQAEIFRRKKAQEYKKGNVRGLCVRSWVKAAANCRFRSGFLRPFFAFLRLQESRCVGPAYSGSKTTRNPQHLKSPRSNASLMPGSLGRSFLGTARCLRIRVRQFLRSTSRPPCGGCYRMLKKRASVVCGNAEWP